MAIDTYKELPKGLAALERRIGDVSEPWEYRQTLWDIADNLSRKSSPFEPRGSRNSWVETLYVTTATTTVSGTSSETIMVPDFTFAANYMTAGKALRYTLLFDVSTVITTPGTLIYKLRWGGVGGTTLATSGTFAPDSTAASTTITMMVEWWVTCRTDGSSGSFYTIGRLMVADLSTTAATLQSQLAMIMVPPTASAAVTVNTTTSNALSPTSTASVTTGSLRTYNAYLEALN